MQEGRGKGTIEGVWGPTGTQSLTSALSNGTIPNPLRAPFLRLEIPNPTQNSAIISGMGNAMHFKFSRYIHRVHQQKPIKNFGAKAAWAYPGTAQFLGTPYYLSNG